MNMGAGGKTLTLPLYVASVIPALTALTSKVKLPVDGGVPVRAPVDGFSESQVGNALPVARA